MIRLFSTRRSNTFLRGMGPLTVLVLAALLGAPASQAQDLVIDTFAGGGPEGLPPDETCLGLGPDAVLFDDLGGFYVATGYMNTVLYGEGFLDMTTVVGNRAECRVLPDPDEGGQATGISLFNARGLARDAAGNLYVSDTQHYRILRVDAATGAVTRIAGTGVQADGPDGGLASETQIAGPTGLALDGDGNLFFSDTLASRVRRIDALDGTISTVAGTGADGFGLDGPATASALNLPHGLAFDEGYLLVADTWNNRVRAIDLGANWITTIVGTGTQGSGGDGGPAASAQLYHPMGIAVDDRGWLYIADHANHKVRYVDGFLDIHTLAGTGVAGFSGDGSPATGAQLYYPTDVATFGSGQVMIADSRNGRVRFVSSGGQMYTWAGVGDTRLCGDGYAATRASLFAPQDATVFGDDVYIADECQIRRVSRTTGVIATVAGTGYCGFSGDSGPATAAQLDQPGGVALDAAGNIYVADTENHRIRRIDAATEAITTVATPSQVSEPHGLFVDGSGDVYIADSGNNRVRLLSGGTLTTIAGLGSAGYSGDGGAATAAELAYPTDVTLTAAGVMFIADSSNDVVRQVDSGGTITTFAGSGTRGFAGDGGPATAAELSMPHSVAVDAAENLYISDHSNWRIRRVEAASADIDTVAGRGLSCYGADGGDGAAATAACVGGPKGLDVASDGRIFVADPDNHRVRVLEEAATLVIYATVWENGEGEVHVSPSDQTCVISGGTTRCSFPFAAGTEVTVTATGTGDSVFTHWGGGPCGTGTDPICTLTLPASGSSVFARPTFQGPQQFYVEITPDTNGLGQVEVSPPDLTAEDEICMGNPNASLWCLYEYRHGTEITLTATPLDGSVFLGWGGEAAGCGTSLSCTYRLEWVGGGAFQVEATFQGPQDFTVWGTAAYDGSGQLELSPPDLTPEDEVVPVPGGGLFRYPMGTELTVTAVPAADSVLVSWDGVCSGTAGSVCSYTVDPANGTWASAEAVFHGPETVNVTVTEGGGSGQVEISPSDLTPVGEVCTGACEYSYVLGTELTLEATPAPDTVFIGWAGACSGTNPICTFTASSSAGSGHSVEAQFQGPEPLTVWLNSEGGGSGQVALSPPDTTPQSETCTVSGCDYLYRLGTVVTLTATPAADSVFDGWLGDECSSFDTNPVCTFTVVDSNWINVDAYFRGPKDVSVFLIEGPDATGRVEVRPADLSAQSLCASGSPQPCTFTHRVGTELTLTAIPEGDSTFDGWGLACTGTSPVCTIEMSPTGMPVEATFGTPCVDPPDFLGVGGLGRAAGTTCAVEVFWPSATPACGSEVTYNVYRSRYSSRPPGLETLVASGLTEMPFTDTQGLYPDPRFYYRVRAVNMSNGQQDDNQVVRSITVDNCTTAPPLDVLAFTVTSHNGENHLNWLNPGAGHYSTVVRFTEALPYPSLPADGTAVPSLVGGSEGGVGSAVHSGLTNGTTYYYTAFVEAGLAGHSVGKQSFGRPADDSGAVKWGYTTEASALATAGVVPNTAYYAVSNDRGVHAMQPGAAGGMWPDGWAPLSMNAPAEGRPLALTLRGGTTVLGATRVGFVASEDGRVYAFDAESGEQLWVSEVLGTLQGSVSAQFTGFGAGSDLLVVGTRVSGSPNALYGLKLSNGSLAWSYTDSIGLISSQVSMDIANGRIYFTSGEYGAAPPHTVWYVNFTDFSVSPGNFAALGPIEAPAILRGGYLFVGTIAGTLYALDPDTLVPAWSYTPATGVGRVTGLWVDSTNSRVFFAAGGTPAHIHGVGYDSGSAWALWPEVSITSASSPLLWQGNLYVGGGNSEVWEIDAASGAPGTPIQLGDPAVSKTVGRPTLDVRTGLMMLGTTEGVVYAVEVPFPPVE